MGTPDGAVRVLLVALMAGVTAYHVTRLAVGRPGRTVDVDLTHAGMGVVMVLMLADRLGGGEARVLLGCFAVTTGWFVVRAVRTYVLSGAPAATPFSLQTVPGVAMVYMLAVATTPRSGAAMAMPPGSPGLTWLVVAGLVFGTVPAVTGPRLSLGAGCRVAMSATACLMLLTS